MSTYTYENSTVLVNLAEIRDAHKLRAFEGAKTALRIVELRLKPIVGDFDLTHMQAIHRHIFQDVYPWAGQIRHVSISKDYVFVDPDKLIEESDRLFDALRSEDNLTCLGRDEFTDRAVAHFSAINTLHPFREGNGRTQREFFYQLGLEAGYPFQWSRITNDEMVESQIQGRKGDFRYLRQNFERALDPQFLGKTAEEIDRDNVCRETRRTLLSDWGMPAKHIRQLDESTISRATGSVVSVGDYHVGIERGRGKYLVLPQSALNQPLKLDDVVTVRKCRGRYEVLASIGIDDQSPAMSR